MHVSTSELKARLRAQVTEHKAAIRFHKEALRRVASELARLEADGRSTGASVSHQQPTGVGAIRGQ